MESLLKWFAPILVFTTDEIYSLIYKGDKIIHENNFVKIPKNWNNEKLNQKWTKLFKIKQEANIAIEEKRAKKEIGSSLEAEIILSVDDEYFEVMKDLDLAEYFITSTAKKIKAKNEDKIYVEVKKAEGVKCQRCWKVLVSKCKRCEEVLKQ